MTGKQNSVRKKIQLVILLCGSSNVSQILALEFGAQLQGIGDMKISNCHVYGLADMTVPVHGTYVFEKGEVSRTTAHSY